MEKQAQPTSAELIGGPQDGAKVHAVGGDLWSMPQTIYVGPKWLGDGYAAWSRGGPSDRFPVCYVLDGYRFRYRPAKR